MKTYGGVFDELSFKSAIDCQPPILGDYKIVTTLISQSEIDALIRENKIVKPDGKEWENENDASTFASLIILKKPFIKIKILNMLFPFIEV